MKLFRVILPAADIEKATRFYQHLLAMPGKRVSPGRHYFDLGGTILACYDPIADGDREPCRPNPEHVYIAVADLEAAHRRAGEAGMAVKPEGIRTWPWGERSFYGADPAGNPICMVDEATVFIG